MDYNEQLKDKRWKLKRVEILIRDKHSCRICGYMGPRVNVHHIKYTGMAWDAPDEDLITLCNDCHRKSHSSMILEKKDKFSTNLSKWLNDLSTRGF